MKRKLLKKVCCQQILDSLEQKLLSVQIICIHFSQCCIFVALLVVILRLYHVNHKDAGMRCNEGPNVWSSNSMYYLLTHISAKQL